MKYLAPLQAIVALATPLLAAALPLIDKRDVGVKVELSQRHATEVNAVLTNSGSEALKLLKYGSLMDKNPVEKLSVFKNGEQRIHTPRQQMLTMANRG